MRGMAKLLQGKFNRRSSSANAYAAVENANHTETSNLLYYI
jgi:hypothetical protein